MNYLSVLTTVNPLPPTLYGNEGMVISEEDLCPELSETASRSGCITALFYTLVRAEEENAGLQLRCLPLSLSLAVRR